MKRKSNAILQIRRATEATSSPAICKTCLFNSFELFLFTLPYSCSLRLLVEKCQTRWRSLRTRYRREMVKLERIMRKEKPKKEKHIWQYRGRLSFLFDHLRSRGYVNIKIKGAFMRILIVVKIKFIIIFFYCYDFMQLIWHVILAPCRSQSKLKRIFRSSSKLEY